jgi:hypothetical protein
MIVRLAALLALYSTVRAWSSDAPPVNQQDATTKGVTQELEACRDAAFESLAGRPLLVAQPAAPIRPGRGAFARDYSYSIINFAMQAFWRNEFVDEANAALRENCRFYGQNPIVRDEHDSFYWSADLLCRLVEFFGRGGSRAAGRLYPQTEAMVYEMMWGYCHDNSRRSDAEFERSQTWHISHSENHHHQMISTLWHFSKLLARHTEYRSRTYADGGTPAEHSAAWSAYLQEYLRERVRKGLFIETASKGYNVYTLKGIYNCVDFADDAELRRLARCALDVYWAAWAEEQIDGVRGGAAARVYHGPATCSSAGDDVGRVAGFYLKRTSDPTPVENDFTFLTSSYRLPDLVVDLARHPQERGVYEVRHRVMGLAQPGHSDSPDYRLRTDTGGIVRYAYCTPEFVVGTALLEARPRSDWVTISGQNRWHGVIFAGHPDARLVPECIGAGRRNSRTHNSQWAAQLKGTLIVQKLKTSEQSGAMRVWFAGQGLTPPVEIGGWAFTRAAAAYAAVRPVRGGFTWDPAEDGIPGRWLRCDDEWTPVLFEIARQADYDSFEAFQQAVLRRTVRMTGSRLGYESLSGDRFEFDADQRESPRINDQPLDYAPPRVYDSPFLQSDWNSGVVQLKFRDRELTIDVARD